MCVWMYIYYFIVFKNPYFLNLLFVCFVFVLLCSVNTETWESLHVKQVSWEQ